MRSLEIWLGRYLRQRLGAVVSRRGAGLPRHLLFCVVDHFEPVANGSRDVERERKRMQAWRDGYPALARRHRDSDGVPPQHTWFYPGENYRPEYLDALSELCGQGLGEVELHLHHGHDSAGSLRRRLLEAVEAFNRHGALITQGVPGVKTYGFIHGNLALDNSMGDPRWCGVNNELEILQETGCFADFSMPTAPARSQTRTINAIYYAVDDPRAPKSHDTGVEAEVGKKDREGLLIVGGPLALDWTTRKFGLLPHIDNGHIVGRYPGTPDRVMRWARQHIHVKGRPEWVAVKVACHGAEEEHFDALLGAGADRMYGFLERRFRDRDDHRLHYVTARELYNIIKAAEAGGSGDPGQFRDFLIPPYVNRLPVGARPGESRGH
jgi:hypothetical protein